jgi:hypothetical protein
MGQWADAVVSILCSFFVNFAFYFSFGVLFDLSFDLSFGFVFDFSFDFLIDFPNFHSISNFHSIPKFSFIHSIFHSFQKLPVIVTAVAARSRRIRRRLSPNISTRTETKTTKGSVVNSKQNRSKDDQDSLTDPHDSGIVAFRPSANPFGSFPPDPMFDRGSSYLAGTENGSAASPRRVQIGTDSSIEPLTSQ